MKHIKTIYLGCDSHEIANTSNHIIRFCKYTLWSHVTIMSHFSYPLWETDFQSDFNVTPKKFCVLLPEREIYNKLKPENQSTGLETITWFIENFHPPRGGAIFSLYSYNDTTDIETRWSAQAIWPLKEECQWVGDGDYITLHDVEPNTLLRGGKKGEDQLTERTYSIIRNLPNLPIDYEVKYIDYTMGEDEIFKLLKHSRLHVSYHGGTGYSSGMINCPTVIFGWPGGIKVAKEWDGKETIVQKTGIGSGTSNSPQRIFLYDWEKRKIYQGPQEFQVRTDNSLELTQYLTGMSPLQWHNRSYQL